MIRKILLAAVLFGASFATINAQEFHFTKDTVTANTHGVTPPAGSSYTGYAIDMFNYIHNTTADTMTVQWQIIQNSLPFGWSLYTLCDNFNCRTSADATIANNSQSHTSPIAAGDSSLLEPSIAVPVEGDNGTGILKVRIWTTTSIHTVDTAVFIVNKTATGITTIKMDDNRVSLYPNPASNSLMVYTDKNLNSSKISVLNITGQAILTTSIPKGKETTDLNISTFAKGTYIVNVTDEKGNLVTSRKFVKK